jgi:hypothetical protein
MRSTFGHDGDLVEAMHEIYSQTKERSTKRLCLQVIEAGRDGGMINPANITGFWPEWENLNAKYNRL